MASDSGPVTAVIVAIVVAIAVLVTLPVLGQFAVLTSDQGQTGATNQRVSVSSSSFSPIGASPVSQVTVRDSTGRAIAMGYDDASVSAPGAAPSESPLSLSVWAELNESASVANDYVLLDANGTAVLQYRDGDYVALFNNSTSYALVSTPAPAPKSLTHVGLRVSNGTLSIVVNGSVANTTSLQTGNRTAQSSTTLFGTIDEVRTWSRGISNQTFSELYSDPVGGQQSTSSLARIMFDEGSGDSAYVIYIGSSATLNGPVTWTDGLSGETLTERGTFVSGDYVLDNQDGRIKATSGGKLADAPVAYVSYVVNPSEKSFDVFSGVVSAMRFVPLIILVLLSAVVISKLR